MSTEEAYAIVGLFFKENFLMFFLAENYSTYKLFR